MTCDATWLLEFELYEPSQAVRYGQVDFALTLPGYEYGNVPNNPRIRSAYQYPNTLVFDSSLVITDWDEIGRKYTGYILMESADAVIVEFDLWCKTFTSEEPYTLTRTYTWTIPESGTPLPSPTPNATISDIRYVSFGLALDADPALDPLGIFIKSQVQLRNLKSNL
ncbi:MAG: hypothetical protein O3A36_01335 [bacterium]|nr:hypothetical protein [bacterium]